MDSPTDAVRDGQAAEGSHSPDRSAEQDRDQDCTTADAKLGEDAGSTPSNHELRKQAEILQACRSTDVASLRSLAESEGGFLTDALRRASCEFLLTVASPSALPRAVSRALLPHPPRLCAWSLAHTTST